VGTHKAFVEEVEPTVLPATDCVQVAPALTGAVIAPAHSSLVTEGNVVMQILKELLASVLFILT
jgi:hypothetical protein